MQSPVAGFSSADEVVSPKSVGAIVCPLGDDEPAVPSSEGVLNDPDVEAEEVSIIRVAPRPPTPSALEWQQHLPLHEPYRSWCPGCVASRAISENIVGPSQLRARLQPWVLAMVT